MRAENVIEYYALNNKLKDLIRTGWKTWNVNKERIESVAEHIYGVEALSIAMYSEYEYDLDFNKVMLMIAIHELEEIIIGDLTSWDISKEEKNKIGHKAVNKILSPLKIKDKLYEIILEFDKRETKEAKFAYHLDKLECDIQAKLYDEAGLVNLDENINNKIVKKDSKVKELLNKKNYSWSKMWINYDKSKYIDDENFMDVINYVENNNISKFKEIK